MNNTNPLVGKQLTGLKITADKIALKFRTTEGDVLACTDADCCSSTWIESVENTVFAFPALVLSVEDLDMPDLEESWKDGKECIQYYGCKITTDRGVIIIDYRNESNGYYGGWLSWTGEQFYGGVYGQNCPKGDWQELES
jgi:hypothetical protein